MVTAPTQFSTIATTGMLIKANAQVADSSSPMVCETELATVGDLASSLDHNANSNNDMNERG